MNAKLICSVMLFNYNALEKRCEWIDKTIFNTAVHSARKDTWEVCKRIEQLTQEKIAYINTKVVVDNALATLNRTYELEHHHFNGGSIEEIANALNEKWKTIEQRACRQREKLYQAIESSYTAEELLEMISGSAWLMHKYKEAVKRAENKQADEE